MRLNKTFKLFLALLFGGLPLIILLGTLSFRPSVVEGKTLQESSIATAEIKNFSSDLGQVSFTLLTPPPTTDELGKVLVDGLQDHLDTPGRPALPYYTALIVLPPVAEAGVTIDIKEVRHSFLPALESVAAKELAPYGVLDGLSYDFNQGDFPKPESVEPREAKNEYFPGMVYELSDPMYVRDLRLVRLKVFPLRYNEYTDQLAYAPEMEIAIHFYGADFSSRHPLADPAGQTARGLESQILNYKQAEGWRSLPALVPSESINLPEGQGVYKIGVSQDGIYELTAEQLAAAGMVIGPGGVDPGTFQMIYRGETVSYQLVGNGDNKFDPGEAIRFYGWAFDGSRLERQFISENVFWLWAEGDPVLVTSKNSVSGTEIVYVNHSMTEEHDLTYFSGYTNHWQFFPNEPDAWFWYRFDTSFTPVTQTLAFSLEHPLDNGPDATLTAEFSSKEPINHSVSLSVNGHALPGIDTWYGTQNLNVTRTMPLEYIHDGTNHIEITASSTSGMCKVCILLNRITTDYNRKLVVVDDQIIFSDDSEGLRQYHLSGFDKGLISETLIWDISDRLTPVIISPDSLEITGTDKYTVTFGADESAEIRIIATTIDNLLSPENLSSYEVPNLDPASGKADWVAIAHEEFITETKRLADHRSSLQFGALTTHVVDIEDVINKFGFGLPIPTAIQSYLTQAIETWDVAPRYLLLVGDSTIDPRHIYASWTDKQYIMTDLVFEDFWQGQIPSDNTFALLVGDDKLPDIAVGRMTVKMASELGDIIDKTIQYEENHLLPASWMENIIFVADNDDSAGQFCEESIHTGNQLPSSLRSTYLCLDDYGLDPELLREELFSWVNSGVSLLNYRGHGGPNFWANILSNSHLALLDNPLRPFVSLSGDCLDANFALPDNPSLGEGLTRATDIQGSPVGAAAHWGSTGLGTSDNHTRLIDAFYQALFIDGQTAVGEAIMVAKGVYGLDPNNDTTLLSSFTLLGDPAMQLFRRSLSSDLAGAPALATVADTLTFTIEATNQGVYPTYSTISQTLPAGFEFVSVSSNVSTTYEVTGSGVIFDLQFGELTKDKGIPRNGIVTLVATIVVSPDAVAGKVESTATIYGSGEESWPGDEQAATIITIVRPTVFIPYINR